MTQNTISVQKNGRWNLRNSEIYGADLENGNWKKVEEGK